MAFKIGELVQWENSDGKLCIDVIRKNPSTGKPYFWNIDFVPEQYPNLKKLDVSVLYFNDMDDFVDI